MRKRKERKVIRKSDNCWLVATTITFNIKDPHQLTLLEFAEAMPNFSGTVKRLIAQEMTGNMAPLALMVDRTPAVDGEDTWTPPEAQGEFDETWAAEEFL